MFFWEYRKWNQRKLLLQFLTRLFKDQNPRDQRIKKMMTIQLNWLSFCKSLKYGNVMCESNKTKLIKFKCILFRNCDLFHFYCDIKIMLHHIHYFQKKNRSKMFDLALDMPLIMQGNCQKPHQHLKLLFCYC